MRKKLILLISFLYNCIGLAAQDGKVELADSMRSNGKIYVVVAVVLTIFAGIILYLIRLDRKITKLEKNQIKF